MSRQITKLCEKIKATSLNSISCSFQKFAFLITDYIFGKIVYFSFTWCIFYICGLICGFIEFYFLWTSKLIWVYSTNMKFSTVSVFIYCFKKDCYRKKQKKSGIVWMPHFDSKVFKIMVTHVPDVTASAGKSKQNKKH